ncbi:MAG: Ig-like domain-containing protein [bacterium]|nr:Ig-like domain-containing protein [bacterium]
MSKKKKSSFLLKSLIRAGLIVFLPVFLLAIAFAVYAMSTDSSILNTGLTNTVIKSDSAPVVQTADKILTPTPVLIPTPTPTPIKTITNIQTVDPVSTETIIKQPIVSQPPAEAIIKQPENVEVVLDADCKKKNILDIVACKNYLALPLDCRQKGSTSLEECWKDMPVITAGNLANEILPECRQSGITVYENCKIYMSLSSECRDQNIKTVADCDKYLAVQPECRDKKIFDKEKCDKYMSLPADCRKKQIDDVEECQKFIYKNTMPAECKKAGSKTQEECSQVLFILSLPAECRDKKIINNEECSKYLLVNSLPQECRDKGATTEEECKKIIKDSQKEDDSKKIIQLEPKSNNDIKCREVNIADPVECEKFLKKTLLPQECQKSKITTEKECNDFLFKKTAPKECLVGGITNEKECKEFMFNKYLPKVQKIQSVGEVKIDKAQINGVKVDKVEEANLDNWQRKNVIKDVYLGDIVTKQTQFQDIKNNIVDLTAESPKVIDIIKKYQVAEELIPIKEEGVGLKVIVVKDSITLDSTDNLIQASPIALMIDSDQDGLSDDMEKRFGTNPNDKDTDKDGYEDGVEVSNKYNPMGAGKLKQPLEPIDQAIVENKILGQPKTEGKKVEHLSVTKVDNSVVQKAGASYYEFSGKAKANSVITLYIYSDLPMIVTVKTDEFGNWKYSFNQPLVDGKHEIYVAVNDNTGKVVEKSNPLSFFVKEAKAVSVNDFVAPASASSEDNEAKGFLAYYLIAGAIVGMGLSLFLLFIKQRKYKL